MRYQTSISSMFEYQTESNILKKWVKSTEKLFGWGVIH